MNIKQYNKDRDHAITELIKTGSLDEWFKVVEKYKLNFPKNEIVVKGALYKAAQQCLSIPSDLKQRAAEECRKLGMNPYSL